MCNIDSQNQETDRASSNSFISQSSLLDQLKELKVRTLHHSQKQRANYSAQYQEHRKLFIGHRRFDRYCHRSCSMLLLATNAQKQFKVGFDSLIDHI